MRIAYLNTRYPSLSHTFIEREVAAVRAEGVEVQTFSIRPPSNSDQLSEAHRDAVKSTRYLLDGFLPLCVAALAQFSLHPLRSLLALAASQRLSPPGLKAHLLHIGYLAEAARFVREMRHRSLNHVHVHMANNGAAVALLATKLEPGIRYSLSIHGSAEFFHVDSWCLRAKVEGAVFVRCISHFCRAQVMAWTSPDVWDRVHIVHCGVDTSSFAPAMRRTFGPLRILTVGRLDPIKGYPLLLKACRELLNRGIDWTLDMVGDGPIRELLRTQARKLEIDDRITFSGAVGQDGIQGHFDRADVMVVSSFMEGVPVVLMEAMAKEMAVVATAVGGVPELIQHGVNGLLVTPGSADALAETLEQLAKSRSNMVTLGAAARRKIIQDFDVARSGTQMAQLFDRYCIPRESLDLQESSPQHATAMTATSAEGT